MAASSRSRPLRWDQGNQGKPRCRGVSRRVSIEDMHPTYRAGDTELSQRDRLTRRSGGRVIGGVAGGIADHLGVDALKVRLVFVLLAVMAGSGFVAYGLLWVFVPGGVDTKQPSETERRQAYGLAVLGLAFSLGASLLFSGSAVQWIVPVVAIAIGAAMVWHEFDSQGARSAIGLPVRPTVLTSARIVGGASLIVLGLGFVVLARIDLSSLGPALLAVAVTLVGAGLLTVPLWLRMLRALNAERSARIRNEEREEIASHLHDSVLQTLALIQRQSENPQEVLRLARSQERELRKWLFDGPEAAHASLAAALRTIAGEVEDHHGVKVTPVTVGDLPMAPGDGAGLTAEQFTALLGATREALVNAAKHSGAAEIDLFAETEPHQLDIFVRDRGIGFDESAVPADRHGLARSIRGRVERRGGRIVVRSTVGKGTEIRISMPRTGVEATMENRASEATGDSVPASEATGDSAQASEATGDRVQAGEGQAS